MNVDTNSDASWGFVPKMAVTIDDLGLICMDRYENVPIRK